MLSKRGQIAETMTWVVATLIIIVLLSISIYASTFLAKTKIIHYGDDSRTQDIVMEKSLFAYFQIKDSSAQTIVLEDLSSRVEQGYFYADFDSKLKKLRAYLE